MPRRANELAKATVPSLAVRDIVTHFSSREGVVRAVDGVSFDVLPGQMLCIVGESGCGKSALLRSILGLIDRRHGAVVRAEGIVEVGGVDITTLQPPELQRVRGREMALIPQDPVASLNPLLRVGDQVRAVMAASDSNRRFQIDGPEVTELLARVGIPEPRERASQYPHEFSGGMLQRVMIAMAIANRPGVILADEPTTALDVTIQAQILDLLTAMQAETNTAVVFVTHDLGVVAEIADHVIVMYAGRAVEAGPAAEVLAAPTHPYTRALLESRPDRHESHHKLSTVEGQPPTLGQMEVGCSFQPRCWLSNGRSMCLEERPALEERVRADIVSACHFADEVETEKIEGKS